MPTHAHARTPTHTRTDEDLRQQRVELAHEAVELAARHDAEEHAQHQVVLLRLAGAEREAQAEQHQARRCREQRRVLVLRGELGHRGDGRREDAEERRRHGLRGGRGGRRCRAAPQQQRPPPPPPWPGAGPPAGAGAGAGPGWCCRARPPRWGWRARRSRRARPEALEVAQEEVEQRLAHGGRDLADVGAGHLLLARHEALRDGHEVRILQHHVEVQLEVAAQRQAEVLRLHHLERADEDVEDLLGLLRRGARVARVDAEEAEETPLEEAGQQLLLLVVQRVRLAALRHRLVERARHGLRGAHRGTR